MFLKMKSLKVWNVENSDKIIPKGKTMKVWKFETVFKIFPKVENWKFEGSISIVTDRLFRANIKSENVRNWN